MNILITNDDGIDANGIKKLANAAKKFGNVRVFAPKEQCSAMSHRLTLGRKIDVVKTDMGIEGIEAYSVDGTPADCVKIGMLKRFGGEPDVVLSGINQGFNLGIDIQYSGTVAGAMEGAMLNIISIAFSEPYTGICEVTDTYLEKMIGELINKPLGYGEIWNVNFPDCKASELKGISYDRKVSRSAFYLDNYLEEKTDNGISLISDGIYNEKAEEGTDFEAIVSNHISVGVVNNIGVR